MEQKNEMIRSEANVAIVESDEGGLLMDLTSAVQSFCTLEPHTDEERISLFNAINSPEKHLRDCINMEITVQHIYAERCEFVDVETTERRPGVRMVFISPDGTSYQAASNGVFNCTKKLFQIMGTPDRWPAPVVIVPRQVTRNANRVVLVYDVKGFLVDKKK